MTSPFVLPYTVDLATDFANAGVALPSMFYMDLGSLARGAAYVLGGGGPCDGEANEPMEYLGELAAAHAAMAEKLRDGTAADGEMARTTMPTLSRLIRDAEVQAEGEWEARHKHAL